MPEIVPAAASTEAASSSSGSTADIAASVIADIDSGGSGEGETPVASATADPPTSQVDPDDFDAVPADMTDSLGRKRVNAIPHPRVKTMIEKKVAARERELIATVAKELGITKAEAELKLDDVLGGVKERGTKLTDFESRFKNVDAVERVMAEDPERFMELLPQINPAYKQWVRQQQQAEARAAAVGDDDPEPEPDYDLGDGRKTYSLEGMRKRDAWKERQIEKRLEGKFGERLKPFEEEQRQKQLEREAQAKRDEFNQQLEKRLDRARKWVQFKEHEGEILKHMDAQKALGNFISFEDAYMELVVPKLVPERARMRQEILEEQNKTPHSTSVAASVAPKADAKPKTTADIAREVMKQFTT